MDNYYFCLYYFNHEHKMERVGKKMPQGQFIPKFRLAELTGIEQIRKGRRERKWEGGGGREEEKEEVP